MTDTMIPSVEISAPTAVPYPFGLFSVPAVQTPADPHWQAGAWWRSLACNQVGVTFGVCQVDDEVPEKNVNVLCGIVTGFALTVYARSDESMGGGPLDEKFAAARALLLAGEQYAVEQALWQKMLDATPTEDATAASVVEGVAMAEALIADNYGGSPVLHVSRYTATMAGVDVLRVDGTRLRTFLGSAVVAGGGYEPSPTEPGPALSIISTGALVIVRSEVFDLGQSYNTDTNQIDAVVERSYVIGWDCSVVRVEVPASP